MSALLIRCCKHALYVSKQVLKVFSVKLVQSNGFPNRIRSLIPNNSSVDVVVVNIVLVHMFFLSIKVLLHGKTSVTCPNVSLF